MAGLACSLGHPAGLTSSRPARQPAQRLPTSLAPLVRLGRQRLLPGSGGAGGGRAAARAPTLPRAGRRAEPWDPDSYEHEPQDDPDEYEHAWSAEEEAAPWAQADVSGDWLPPFRAPAAAAAGAAAAGAAAAAVSSTYNGAYISSSSSDAGDRQGRPPHERASRTARVLLLALQRLAMRLATAVLATARVTWQLVSEAVLALSSSARVVKQRAQQGFAASSAGERARRWRQKLEAVREELPEDLWGKVMWVWDRPHVQKIRLTISMANFSIRLPALVALVATQIGLLSTSLSLPMLAPLLLGTGMLMRSIRTNAGLVFPRIGLLVVLLWLLWFANSVIQNTVAYLRKQGALDQRLANNINSAAELTVLVTAGVILLSMIGVNVSALLLPAGIAAAVAAKDLSHNFLAGFFLMMVQPFRLGDRVGVTLPAGSPGSFGSGGTWFEGVCDKVDLRYTSLRQGKRRLMVPNSAFLQQPFMITEDAPTAPYGYPPPPGGAADAAAQTPGYMYPTHDGRNVWQSYVNGGPVHQELAAEQAAAAEAAAAAAAGGPQQPLPQQAYAAPQGPGSQQYAAPQGPGGQQYAAPQANGQQLNSQAPPMPQQQQQQQQQTVPQGAGGAQQAAGPGPYYYGYQPAPPGSYGGTPPGPPPGAYHTGGGSWGGPVGWAPPGQGSAAPRLSSHPLPPEAFK